MRLRENVFALSNHPKQAVSQKGGLSATDGQGVFILVDKLNEFAKLANPPIVLNLARRLRATSPRFQ